MEYFINNLCYKKFENLNFFEKEYIEIKKIDKIEKKAKTFLLKKRKNSFDFNEIENLCQNENINIKKGRKSLSKKKSLKSDHKNNHKKITQKIKKLNKLNNKWQSELSKKDSLKSNTSREEEKKVNHAGKLYSLKTLSLL